MLFGNQFSSEQSLSCVRVFVTPQTEAKKCGLPLLKRAPSLYPHALLSVFISGIAAYLITV